MEKIKFRPRIIVYGIGNTLQNSLKYITNRFEIIACSDTNADKRFSPIVSNYNYCNPSDLYKLQFDYIVITSVYSDEIYDELVNEKKIDSKKILKMSDLYRLPVETSFGDKNEDKTFYIIFRDMRIRNGLMSYIFGALQQLGEIQGTDFYPVVDMQTYPNQYLDDEKIGIENSWEYYFDQLSPVKINEVYQSKKVIIGYDDPNYLGNYSGQYDLAYMHEMYKKYIKMKPDVQGYIQSEFKSILKPYRKPLGVLLRGSDMVDLKLKHHPVQPTVDEMIQYVYEYKDKWGCDVIYLSTEDSAIFDRFVDEFGKDVVYYNQKRFGDTKGKWLSEISFDRLKERYLRGLEYLTTIELLAKCDNMICSICAASMMTQIIHGPQYENLLVLNKGSY